MAEKAALRVGKNMPNPLSSVRRPGRPGPSSIYDPARSRNPMSTQSEAPPHSPGINRAWPGAPTNHRMVDNRQNSNSNGDRIGSFASMASRAAPTPVRATAGGQGFNNLGSTQTVMTEISEMTVHLLRKDERVYTRDHYLVGTVFSTAHHVQDQELGPLPPDRLRTESNAGRIISKYRKFIVVANYWYHCVAIPIFTHEGKGLSSKPPKLVDEFVSVRDNNQPNIPRGDTKHGILLTRSKGFERGFAAMSSLSNAQLSHPFSHSYSKPCVMHSRLDPASTQRLSKLYVECIDNGLDELFRKMRIADSSPPLVEAKDPEGFEVVPRKGAKGRPRNDL